MFDYWVGKIPWRREWLPISVFLPEESHGQRSPVGYSHNYVKFKNKIKLEKKKKKKESDTTKRLTVVINPQTCT